MKLIFAPASQCSNHRAPFWRQPCALLSIEHLLGIISQQPHCLGRQDSEEGRRVIPFAALFTSLL